MSLALMQPDLVVLDEPATGLDIETEQVIKVCLMIISKTQLN